MLVGDINPGEQGSAPSSLTRSGLLLYFTADDGTSGRELWALNLLLLSDGGVSGELRPDADSDGVPDILDVCPDTLTDEAVNTNGCSCRQLDVDCDDDGDLCTVDLCVAGECAHYPVTCPEGQTCDPNSGRCVIQGPRPVSGFCAAFDLLGLIILPASMLMWAGVRRRGRQQL